MRLRKHAATLALGAALTLSAAQVSQAQFIVNYSFTLTTKSGPDGLGLNGASLALALEFANPSTYIVRFGFPVVDAVSHSLTISGASVGSSNGVFFEPVGVALYPTFDGQYFRAGAFDGFADFDIGGAGLRLVRLTNPVGGISGGDPVALSHFGTTAFDLSAISSGNWSSMADGTQYAIGNFQASIRDNVIPEPATLTLLGLGLTGAGLGRRRWQRIRKGP